MSETASSESGYSAFRTSEKHFKSRTPHPQIASGLITRRLRKRIAASSSYPLLSEQGVLDLARPSDNDLDEVRTAGWKPEEDATGGRPVRRIDVKRNGNREGSFSGYIVGDGMSISTSYLFEY
jgi:hypothetical protein